ncbi:MAG: hypothetical protein A2729_03730 [Candidatus Buchananbacteria bacterium RIFCSPHIGHO2_01_FULL_39_14]|uniref:Uncharacterized protein n=2 Tax=Candidatus Buchananiibacteriota TaxID=1817903 RepID=A0A1G1YPF1_9BACT|nr:MAG: hypothetical protein A2729_03730 [Candidatus Buchananbacteria bacterium RIFCSPHIGHO2_01_FULL_39_14]OGY48489.1 MAG: hypothetical protein A3D39_04910 [Candidatus Buchananbacteria bacterium RIFCSPHIGHO2_02_FULL_39_17]OGY54243.1 MAG: hypothetical protein A2912_04340 [Candidatus Buchananbacteria bacterium RIFCSPLOWO2_01_FULL_40_23b]
MRHTGLKTNNKIAPPKKFASSSEGAAEGGCGGNSAAPERPAERSEAGQCRFHFLDLCIRFGKMISKICEGFNSGAIKLDTNSFFEDERVRSPRGHTAHNSGQSYQ